MKRAFDALLALVALFFLSWTFLIIFFAVRLTSDGPAIYWSDRVGKNNTLFSMPKFRTMYVGTPEVASHLLLDSKERLTSIGGFLRKSSLDELPQLLSILKGDMSFVGPRPALYNQDDLIAMRTERGVHQLLPGLTGLAQVRGRDKLSVIQKVELDKDYLFRRSFFFDIKIIFMTIFEIFKKRTSFNESRSK
jgi:O-antigen biosynthesis protein WbqP